MSKLQTLIDEKNILFNMSDEDYIVQNYAQYITDTYSFIPVILVAYGIGVEGMDRYLAMGLISQAIIIYSVVLY